MSKSCMLADGNTRGNACTVGKTCTAPLVCNQSTGLCDLSGSGNWKDACQTDADCNKDSKHPGLKCSTASICDCTDSSGVLSLCTDDHVCASGSSPPPPPHSSWPAAFPNQTPGEEAQFDGDCSKASWYTQSACPAGNLAARNAGQSSVACITTDNWSKGISPASYDKFCYVPAAR